ncbi:hypothetical protein VTO42DRAFT_4053 [Malbranchea cinnamomea]
MSFGGHQHFAQQWAPDSGGTVPSTDNGHRTYHPHSQNFPPPLYPPPANYYPIPPHFTNGSGIVPPRPPLPFPNAMPAPYPHYGAPPVQTLGFPPFPPVQQPRPTSEVPSETTTPRRIVDVAAEPDAASIQEHGELPENRDSDEREEGELSTGEAEEVTNEARSGHASRQDHQIESRPRNGDLDPERPQNGQIQIDAHSAGSGIGSSDKIAPAIQAYQVAETPSNDLTPPREANNKDVVMTDVSVVETGQKTLEGKSRAQLRALAQGALLNLAPHNIRFHELVAEGIDPVILKSLYDDIGIKVTSDDKKQPNLQSDFAANQELATTEVWSTPVTTSDTGDTGKQTNVTPAEKNVPSGIVTNEPQAVANSKQLALTATQRPANLGSTPMSTPSSKPLERKELIARMLAAKAGKFLSSDSAPTTFVEQPKDTAKVMPVSPIQSSVTQADNTAEEQGQQGTQSSTPSESRVKEINKAQTELARQRIEQLKKQGLRRTQGHITTDSTNTLSTSNAPENGPSDTLTQQVTSQQTFQTAGLQHPLPVKPPEPETGPVPRIPGLFMTTQSESPGTEKSAVTNDNSMQQPVTAARLPRKRPRASDFTDDVQDASTKKPSLPTLFPSTDHRVVIDISEDESMYDSEGDTDGRKVPDKGTVHTARPTSILPLRDNRSSSGFSTNGYSQKSTPGGTSLPQTPMDQEHLEMEILNLRQQIAERERRRKEKLAAAQAQPASTSNGHDTDSLGAKPEPPPKTLPSVVVPGTEDQQISPVAGPNNAWKSVDSVGKSPATTAGATSGDLSTSVRSTRSLSSLEPQQIEELRLKLLRKQEIESGLPLLDAELHKYEAKLAQCREEEKKLLAEIAKGRSGRIKLVEELETLGVETEGLTMEELQETKDSLTDGATADNDNSDTVAAASAPAKSPTDGATELGKETPPSSGVQSEPAPVSTFQDANKDSGTPSTKSTESVEMVVDEPVSGSLEDDRASRSSSAMDESMGSDESSIEKSPEPAKAMDLDVEPTMPSQIAESAASSVSNSPEAVEVSQPHSSNHDKSVSREPSVGSDAYEPPEPEPSDESNNAYSPPFSPAPAGSVRSMDVVSQAGAVTEPSEQLLQHDRRDDKADAVEPVEDEPQTQLNRHFVPYESPLSFFRAYRYHPQYTETVKGGFRSLTYSHNINPHSPLCAYEVSGGVCNDRSCQYQHLRDMSLTDDKILVEMGSLREGKTQKEQDDYVAGLRQIITDMRRDKVKDFVTVATEIAAYRRRFLQDPSRVLAL